MHEPTNQMKTPTKFVWNVQIQKAESRTFLTETCIVTFPPYAIHWTRSTRSTVVSPITTSKTPRGIQRKNIARKCATMRPPQVKKCDQSDSTISEMLPMRRAPADSGSYIECPSHIKEYT